MSGNHALKSFQMCGRFGIGKRMAQHLYSNVHAHMAQRTCVMASPANTRQPINTCTIRVINPPGNGGPFYRHHDAGNLLSHRPQAHRMRQLVHAPAMGIQTDKF